MDSLLLAPVPSPGVGVPCLRESNDPSRESGCREDWPEATLARDGRTRQPMKAFLDSTFFPVLLLVIWTNVPLAAQL